MSDNIREAFDVYREGVDERREAAGFRRLTNREVSLMMQGYSAGALAKQPAPVAEHHPLDHVEWWASAYEKEGGHAVIVGMLRAYRELLAASPAAQQLDTVAVPMELYTCVGKGGRYELLGMSIGSGERRLDRVVVYRNTETGLLYHRTPDDFDARMAMLAGGGK